MREAGDDRTLLSAIERVATRLRSGISELIIKA
jgi:hypothetical protein